jgi:hypothetical protein
MVLVVEGPLNLRVEPGLWAPVLTELPDGYAITVIAGPAESDDISWYQVLTLDQTSGWCDGSFLVLA